MVEPKLIAAGDFDGLRELARKYAAVVRQARA
jgi:hypothetical protein